MPVPATAEARNNRSRSATFVAGDLEHGEKERAIHPNRDEDRNACDDEGENKDQGLHWHRVARPALLLPITRQRSNKPKIRSMRAPDFLN
jgi:hypothetical protein